MTEDDTFKKLKRPSFHEMCRLLESASAKMSIMESRCTFANPVNRDKWFSKYGWSDIEWQNEAVKRGIMHVLD